LKPRKDWHLDGSLYSIDLVYVPSNSGTVDAADPNSSSGTWSDDDASTAVSYEAARSPLDGPIEGGSKLFVWLLLAADYAANDFLSKDIILGQHPACFDIWRYQIVEIVLLSRVVANLYSGCVSE